MREPTQIAVTGLRIRGFHGVLPEERQNGQDFKIDATLQVESPDADELDRTVDYAALSQELAAVVAGEPVDLIETLAQRLLAVCLAQPLVQHASVVVHKPQAPVGLPFDDVEVTLSGRRPAVLSLGSNLGDRRRHLRAALRLLRAIGPVRMSAVYETDPVGGPEQDPFLNVVVEVPASDPHRLLAFAQGIEFARDRERHERWGPRTLDIDLIDLPGVRLDAPELTLPHPRAAERAFVLVPWLEIDPDAVLTGHGRVADLVAGLDTSGVRRTDLRLDP